MVTLNTGFYGSTGKRRHLSLSMCYLVDVAELEMLEQQYDDGGNRFNDYLSVSVHVDTKLQGVDVRRSVLCLTFSCLLLPP